MQRRYSAPTAVRYQRHVGGDHDAADGGYGGAGTARTKGRTAVRRIVVAIGFGMAESLFVKR